MRRVMTVIIVALAAATVAAQQTSRTRAPKLWTDEALDVGAADRRRERGAEVLHGSRVLRRAVDEVRTYPVYLKDREPKGYRDWMRKQGPQPLIETGKSQTEAEWAAAGREVFDGLDLPEFRTDDPRVLAWVDDPSAADASATVAADGTIARVRWLIDHDRQLKITLTECSACHTRVLPDGTVVRGAQGNSVRCPCRRQLRAGRGLPSAPGSRAAESSSPTRRTPSPG